MKQKNLLLFRLVVLLTAMMCALGAAAAEAYACYTSSNLTLTFYYDSQRSSRPGTKFDLNEGSEKPRWVTDGYYANVTSVVISPSFANARPTSTYYWFYHMNQITTVNGLNYLNTEAVTNMSYMFYECSNLTSLDVSGFNTSNVTDMGQMFCECSRLTALDVSHFNTANVVNMTQMFCFCSSLTALDVSDFNTANVTTMYGLFQGCLKLTALDVSNFTTANVTEMNSMFKGCSNLTTIYASSLWRTDAVTSSTNMFKGCTSLVGGMGTTYDADHVDVAYAHIDGGTSNPGYFTELVLEPYACYTPENTTLTFYYDAHRASRPGTTYDTGYNAPGWYSDGTYSSVTQAVFDPSFANARPTSTYCWFVGMSNLASITGMEYLNTSEVTNMMAMFSGCRGLTSLDVSNFNTTNVKDMSDMFYNCSGLTSLDLGNFNTGNVTSMNSMFINCSGLTSLDLSNFNTAKVTEMQDMFNNCSGLTSLDLSSFNTTNVKDMSNMFYNCYVLTSLDLSSFNTSKVTSMSGMFHYCSGLTTIYASDAWSTAVVYFSSQMFSDCYNLVGGQGTTWDSSNPRDMTYAHIDGGTSNPGYFTGKPKEAYACYTSDNTTLTFYYDNLRSTRTGTTYDLNEGSNNPGWQSDGTNVTRAVFDPSFADARPTTTYRWFYNMENLQSITGISYLNTSDVTDMGFMFYGCKALPSLDVSGFNTANVTSMDMMFAGCISLTSFDLSGFNTSKLTNMSYMFSDCRALTRLDLSSFNTANVIYMNDMFGNCWALTSLNLSSFNTAKVTNMRYMFYGCRNLATIYVGNEWSTVAVTNSTNMFYGCTRLVGGMGTTYDASHVDKAYAHIDGGPSNPGYLTEWKEAYACYTSSNTTLTFYYDGLRASRSGTTYDLNEGSDEPEWYSDQTSIYVEQVVFDSSFADARPTTTYCWFLLMNDLQSITGMQYLNTSEVTNMNRMFCQCNRLTSLNVSGFNTTNVTDMSYMFSNCHGLTSLNVSSFNTANVTNMQYMFNKCNSLTSLDMSGFNTTSVTDMSYMFRGCSKLTSLDVSGFNTSNVTDMSYMFYNCYGLTSLDVSHFNTSKVTSMSYMFNNCSGLTSLDLSSFNTSKVTNMNVMFYNCSGLTTIYVGDDWSTAAVTSSTNMFLDCTSLVGGMGTTYDANHVNKAYAHIDGGPSNPGYFTAKNASQRGDVNGDGEVDVADVALLVKVALGQPVEGFIAAAADLDDDHGTIDVGDVSVLINIVLGKTN